MHRRRNLMKTNRQNAGLGDLTNDVRIDDFAINQIGRRGIGQWKLVYQRRLLPQRSGQPVLPNSAVFNSNVMPTSVLVFNREVVAIRCRDGNLLVGDDARDDSNFRFAALIRNKVSSWIDSRRQRRRSLSDSIAAFPSFAQRMNFPASRIRG